MLLPPADSIIHEREDWRARVADHDAVRVAGENLIRCEQKAIDELFLVRNQCAPEIVIDPALADLDLPQHANLMRYWRHLPRDAGADLPARNAVLPEDLRGTLGDLMLLEADPTGADFVYRVYGSNIAINAGQDWTGWTVGAMGLRTGNGIGLFYRAVYVACALSRKPIYTAHEAAPYQTPSLWRRLIVPLAGTTGDVGWFLVANLPEKFRRPDRAREIEMRRRLGPGKG
jgi:hypothetical protein